MDSNNSKNFFQKYYGYIILIIIVIISFIYQIFLFSLYPYSYGVDGAYYNLNVINILETGQMWANDNPFVFYYFSFYALFLDVTLAIKIGIVSLISLIPIPIYFLIKKFTKNEMSALFAALLSTFNPLLFRLAGDFVKNAAGVLFLLCFIYFFIIACEKKHSIKKSFLLFGITYAIFILIVFTHIYPTGFAVSFIFLYFIYAIIYSLVKERKFPWIETKIVLFLGISASLTITIGYFLNPAFFNHFSKIFSFISGLFDFIISFNIKQPSIPNMFFIDPLLLMILISITIIGTIIIIYDLIKKRTSKPILQFFAFAMILYLPVFLIYPNISQYATGFMMPPNPIINFLSILTTFPMTCGIALICFEIYKINSKTSIQNRIIGIIIAIFIMSVLLALPFIPMDYRSRFSFMNFVPAALLMGYSIKNLNIGKRKIFALIIIVFFSSSFIIQTNYFCNYSFRPVLTKQGEIDLLYFKNYVDSNSSLSGSIAIIQNLGIYYFTILITGIESKKSGDSDDIAKEYNETVFLVIEKMGQPITIKPGQQVIRNESNGQLVIILANYTFHD